MEVLAVNQTPWVKHNRILWVEVMEKHLCHVRHSQMHHRHKRYSLNELRPLMKVMMILATLFMGLAGFAFAQEGVEGKLGQSGKVEFRILTFDRHQGDMEMVVSKERGVAGDVFRLNRNNFSES